MKKNSLIPILFVLTLCLSSVIFAQTPPQTPAPANPNPQNPVLAPSTPLPPASNPEIRPGDTSSLQISFPQPVIISPVRDETAPDPMKIDSVNRPR